RLLEEPEVSRAELTFSVRLVEHHLWESSHAQRLSETAAILLTANLEFLTRRLLELTSNEAQRQGARRFITLELGYGSVVPTKLSQISLLPLLTV
ncbi:hypothetical protein A6R68_07623, partial [Neotoma lepida]